MAVEAAAAAARRAAGPRRRVATTLLHPRRLIGRWLDASGASEALCGTTSPAGERECVAAASTPEYRHRRSRTDRVPRTASHPRGRTDTAYRARGADCGVVVARARFLLFRIQREIGRAISSFSRRDCVSFVPIFHPFRSTSYGARFLHTLLQHDRPGKPPTQRQGGGRVLTTGYPHRSSRSTRSRSSSTS